MDHSRRFVGLRNSIRKPQRCMMNSILTTNRNQRRPVRVDSYIWTKTGHQNKHFPWDPVSPYFWPSWTQEYMSANGIERRIAQKDNAVLRSPRSSKSIYHKWEIVDRELQPSCGWTADTWHLSEKRILDERSQYRPCRRCFEQAPINCPNCDRPTLVEAEDEVVKWMCSVCGERVREEYDE